MKEKFRNELFQEGKIDFEEETEWKEYDDGAEDLGSLLYEVKCWNT